MWASGGCAGRRPPPETTLGAGVIRARTVLVIEDDAQIRRAVKTALADSAERIVEAANGHEGLGLAASSRPDPVVLDLGLPDTLWLRDINLSVSAAVGFIALFGISVQNGSLLLLPVLYKLFHEEPREEMPA